MEIFMKHNIYLYFLSSLFFLSTRICYADFELGNTYYAAGNFEKAYKEYLESAQYGDNDAQQNIGAMYYRGEYVPKNKITAYAWMTLAAQNQGYKDKGLNTKIYNKFSDEEKKAADEEYKVLFAKLNNEVIQSNLTPDFVGQTGNTKTQRIIKTVRPEYPRAAIRNGSYGGMTDVTFTVDKYGITRDQITYYSSDPRFSVAALNAVRKFQFEPLLVNGKPVAINGVKMRFNFRVNDLEYSDKKIAKYIDEARAKASSGSSQDKLTFAYLLETVPSFTKDYKLVDNPNEWYVNAANEGNYSASYFLGRNILYGNMCTSDSAKSMGWLLKAARGGISDAQYLLAIETFSGARFEKNDEKGFYWLSKAAEANKFAKVKYAWILSTHPDEKYRNGKLAQELLQSVDDSHTDKLSLYQSRAASAAETGNFDDAIKWQKKAVEDAKELEIPLTQVGQQLNSYVNNSPWRETI
ncbi:MAG: TonB family protein [Gammaproteobacteria bacterium]|nr:MAG: TonB family protein [Gammaproteobacteria bacterium]